MPFGGGSAERDTEDHPAKRILRNCARIAWTQVGPNSVELDETRRN